MIPFTASDWYWQVDSRVYSSAAGAYIEADDAAYAAWRARGGVPTRVPSEAELRAVLASTGALKPVRKITIVNRLIAAEKMAAALAAMDADPVLKARWDAAPEIYPDDEEAITFLTAIGADAAAVLAPE